MYKVLIAEDDELQGLVLVKLFRDHGYETIYTQNGKEALDIYKIDPNFILVTDLNMPIMSGEELIHSVKEIDEDALIIIHTTENNPEDIIHIMNLGVYDYFIKPIHLHDFTLKMKRATEAFELRKSKKYKGKERIARLETQIEWFQYKEKHLDASEFKNKADFHHSLFKNLRLNFTQGAGIGVLSTLASLFSILPKNENGEYVIGSDIIDMFIENNTILQRALKKLEEIENIIYDEFELIKFSGEDLYLIVKEEIENVTKYLEINSNEIIISDIKSNFQNMGIMISKDLFSKIIHELLINALKYSKEKSKIIVLIGTLNNNFTITVINEAIEDQKGRIGIPLEYQNLVFEPFFRLSSLENSKYDTQDYGLGLVFVENVVRRHNGTITANNIKIHSISEDLPITNVEFAISLHLLKN